MITLFILMALCALLAGLFAWAVSASRKATQRRPVVGNINRKFSRAHLRKVYLAPLLIESFFAWLGFTREARGGVQFANIGEGSFTHGVKSYIPDGATTERYLCYKIGSDGDHCAVCGAGDTPLGQSNDLAESGNLDVPIAINLFGVKEGTLRMVTDGTIANGDHVKCAANGRVTKAASTDLSFGIAIIGTDASRAAGDVINVIHCVPHLYVF